MAGADIIHIEALELSAYVGVPEEERALPQRLTVYLTLVPRRDFRALGDEIANAVDYFRVAKAAQTIARMRPRRLIETLAEEIASGLLAGFPLQAVEVEVRKFILPDTAFVAVRIRRESAA